jgi:hypothetical protein
MNALKPCVSFLIPNPNGTGIIVNNAAIYSMEPRDFLELSESERAFVTWYTRDAQENSLEGMVIQTENHDGIDHTLDIPQEYICKRFMIGIRALAS